MAQYPRRDYLEIFGIPLNEDYSTNDIVIAVGKAINVRKDPDTPAPISPRVFAVATL